MSLVAQIEAHQQSGLSQVTFCRRRGLRKGTFSFWKWELTREARTGPSPAEGVTEAIAYHRAMRRRSPHERPRDGRVATGSATPPHLGDDAQALALYEQFMRKLVAELDNSWELTAADIDAALAELRS